MNNSMFALASLVVLIASPDSGAAQVQVTTQVSVDVNGQGGNGGSAASPPALTSDGRYSVFNSVASNLVVGDANGWGDVFLRDNWTGITTLVSISSGGQQGDNGSGFSIDISDDGRFIVFGSVATNLVPSDLNASLDVFLYDQLTGVVECVSVNNAGDPANGHSSFAKISGDGRFVCFGSEATDIGFGSVSTKRAVYVYDRILKTTEMVSVDPFWNEGDGASRFPEISKDGRYVAFVSWATTLVSGDTNGIADYFVRDRLLGVTERVSVDSSGGQAAVPTPASSPFSLPGISEDGRFVVFHSFSDNLVPGDTNQAGDVFIRDRQLGLTERVSVSSSGAQAAYSGPTLAVPTVSADGRYVCFNSWAADLVPNDTNMVADIFVRDRWKGVTELVHMSSSGAQANDWANSASMTSNGRYVIITSRANNLTSTVDTNLDWDVFLHDRMTGGPDVDLVNVFAGQTATLTVTGATPGGVVVLGASLLGQGILPTAWGPLELNGISAFFAFVMDGAGSASVPVWLDPALLGLPLWVQGIDLTMDFPTSVWGGTIQ